MGTANPHRIDIELEADGAIRPTLTCSAPEGASCRLHCGICEDYWQDDHDQHTLIDQGYCLAVEGWFDDPGVIFELYNGGTTPLRSGPVVFSWDGDSTLWAYDPEHLPLEDARRALVDSLSHVDESTDPLTLAVRATAALQGDRSWESVEVAV
ncbi:hypothetical protein [Microbacterium oleivorans]|uniref:Uncharacterized protein n=1 Tax=Microbacterium oleivorans TaxID=273677 RepID=A0A7D5EU97_9MICO|nr:hypothetical protein [Microbacterium oleivorans]QLD10912.1 hypothetical protein HW566_03390 [Microbacterium oleivorans]